MAHVCHGLLGISEKEGTTDSLNNLDTPLGNYAELKKKPKWLYIHVHNIPE